MLSKTARSGDEASWLFIVVGAFERADEPLNALGDLGEHEREPLPDSLVEHVKSDVAPEHVGGALEVSENFALLATSRLGGGFQPASRRPYILDCRPAIVAVSFSRGTHQSAPHDRPMLGLHLAKFAVHALGLGKFFMRDARLEEFDHDVVRLDQTVALLAGLPEFVPHERFERAVAVLAKLSDLSRATNAFLVAISL